MASCAHHILIAELEKFWLRAGTTPDAYAITEGSGWEDEYPSWPKLYDGMDAAIADLNNNFSEDLADTVAIVLAINNETEGTLDKIENSIKSRIKFCESAAQSDQPQARWQIAELLGRKETRGASDLLEKLFYLDSNKYVQRRALSSLYKIDPEAAVKAAETLISESDLYLRTLANEIKECQNEYINGYTAMPADRQARP